MQDCWELKARALSWCCRRICFCDESGTWNSCKNCELNLQPFTCWTA